MKKLILTFSLLLALVPTFTSTAQDATGKSFNASFLSVPAVIATNTFQITNLFAYSTVTTNIDGTIYTNASGTQVVVSSSAGRGYNLLQDVKLWDFGLITGRTNNGFANTYDPNWQDAGFFIRLVGGSAANQAVTFAFSPLYGGSDLYTGYQAPGVNEANCQVITVTATASTEVRQFTKLDLSKFIGASGVRLLRINNGATAASSDVEVLQCSLVGFRP